MVEANSTGMFAIRQTEQGKLTDVNLLPACRATRLAGTLRIQTAVCCSSSALAWYFLMFLSAVKGPKNVCQNHRFALGVRAVEQARPLAVSKHEVALSREVTMR